MQCYFSAADHHATRPRRSTIDAKKRIGSGVWGSGRFGRIRTATVGKLSLAEPRASAGRDLPVPIGGEFAEESIVPTFRDAIIYARAGIEIDSSTETACHIRAS